MMDKPLLVVGIDPGTTVGYFALDVEGNIVLKGSSKELSLSEVISKLMSKGTVVAVGCDKKRAPDFAEKLSIKLGARLVFPKEDLGVNEKRKLCGEREYDNDHERDSLASALYALNEIKHLINRVKSFSKTHDSLRYENKLIEYVVKKGISVSLAYELLTRKRKEETKAANRVVESGKVTQKDFLMIQERLSNQRNENKRLIRMIEEQREKIKKQKKENNKLLAKIKGMSMEKKADDLLRKRNNTIKNLSNEISRTESALKLKEKEYEKLLDNITAGDRIILKRISNLGKEEINSNKDRLNIKKGDILYVDNPSIISETALEQLKGKVDLIITEKKPKKSNYLGILFLQVTERIEKDKNLCFIKRKDLDNLKQKQDIITDIVGQYRQNRRKN